MGELANMPNLGKVAEEKLLAAGITTPEELRAAGSVEALGHPRAEHQYGSKRQIAANAVSEASLIHKVLPAFPPCLDSDLLFLNSATLYLAKFLFGKAKGRRHTFCLSSPTTPTNGNLANIRHIGVRLSNA